MSDLPQLIVLVLGGAIAPPLILLTSLFWGSQRPLPNTTALGLGYFPICTTLGVAGLTLFVEAAGLRTPETRGGDAGARKMIESRPQRA
jgi:hypothetical protein